jgi:hypothetical protein
MSLETIVWKATIGVLVGLGAVAVDALRRYLVRRWAAWRYRIREERVMRRALKDLATRGAATWVTTLDAHGRPTRRRVTAAELHHEHRSEKDD